MVKIFNIKNLKKRVPDIISDEENRGYALALLISGILTIIFIFKYIKVNKALSEEKDIYSILIGLLGGLFFSVLQGFLVKIHSKKNFEKEQLEYVKNLRNFYLTDFKIIVSNLILKYVQIFKENEVLSIKFRPINSNNQINIENLVYNFIVIQALKDLNLINVSSYSNFVSLRIVNAHICYDEHYFLVCEKVEELRKIYKNSNLKYRYPLFTEEEIYRLDFFLPSNYYYNSSKAKEEEKVRKFDKMEIQSIVNEFMNLNEIIKIFNIDFNEVNKEKIIPKNMMKELLEKLEKEHQIYKKIEEEAIFDVDNLISQLKK